MTEMTVRQETFVRSTELTMLEERIAAHLSCAYSQIVEVGRCLNEAKERKLVPHGQWANWLNETAGMNERQAQQWMRIAREVPADSVLATLEYSKIRAIMALPDPEEREQAAKEAKAEDSTVRELEAKIRTLQEQKMAAISGAKRIDAEKKALAADAERTVKSLQAEIEELKNAQEHSSGISPEAQAQIDALKVKLENAQTFAKIQAEKRQEAQARLIDLQRDMKNGSAVSSAFGGEDMMAAARSFVSTAGAVPHMAAEFAGMDAGQRRLYEQALSMIETWCRGAHEALNTIVVG